MRANIMFWALATAIALPAGLHAQGKSGVLNHNSAEAVSLVLAHQDALQLSPVQIEQLRDLQSKLDREQTRFVLVGWRGAPGKTGTPRYARVRVAARPDRYTETRTIVRTRGFSRVPGKAVPRLEQTRVTRLVERPCPFSFLAANQMDLVHGLLTRI